MKRLAPLILVGLAAILFLGIMGSQDAAALGRRGFYSVGMPFVFLYALVAIWSAKYRRASRWTLVVAVSMPLLLVFVWLTVKTGAAISVSTRVAGAVLFSLAALDVCLGFLPILPQSPRPGERPHHEERPTSQ